MILVAGMIVVGLVLAIAAVFVFREAGRLAQEPPPPLFDPEDAYDFVVDHLADIVAATLTPSDVRRILDLQMDYLKQQGVAVNGSGKQPDGGAIIAGPELVSYILERAAATGESYLPEQIFPVIETQLDYLRSIGAVGGEVGPDPAN